MIHLDLNVTVPQNKSTISYGCPDQDTQYLKRRAVSAKRKHPETFTTTKASPQFGVKALKGESLKKESKEKDCSKLGKTQHSPSICKQSDNSSVNLSNTISIVTTYDSKANFVVVSQASPSRLKKNQASFDKGLENDLRQG